MVQLPLYDVLPLGVLPLCDTATLLIAPVPFISITPHQSFSVPLIASSCRQYHQHQRHMHLSDEDHV